MTIKVTLPNKGEKTLSECDLRDLRELARAISQELQSRHERTESPSPSENAGEDNPAE